MVPEDEVVAGRSHDAPLALQVGGVGRGVARGHHRRDGLAAHDYGAAARRCKKEAAFRSKYLLFDSRFRIIESPKKDYFSFTYSSSNPGFYMVVKHLLSLLQKLQNVCSIFWIQITISLIVRCDCSEHDDIGC